MKDEAAKPEVAFNFTHHHVKKIMIEWLEFNGYLPSGSSHTNTSWFEYDEDHFVLRFKREED